VTVYTVTKGWRAVSGRSYGIVEVRMDPAFQFDSPHLWGLVNLVDLPLRTTIDVLRIIGDPTWHPRFSLRDIEGNPPEGRWPNALGQYGSATALSGVFCRNANVRIRRLECYGLPGAGLFVSDRCPKLTVESALYDRVGWPVYVQEHPTTHGMRLGPYTSRDAWWNTAWGAAGDTRAVALRGLEPRGVRARGESGIVSRNYVLSGVVHAGDGFGLKLGGSDYTVRGYSGGGLFVSGREQGHLTKYPGDPAEYAFVLHPRGAQFEDTQLLQQGAWSGALCPLTVAGEFDEPPVFRRGVIKRSGSQPFAVQLNIGARVVLDGYDFIGWGTDPQACVSLAPQWTDPKTGFTYPASSIELVNCRAWAS
jgi:hypothetical protein